LNAINSFDPEQGIGFHSLGHFAAGALGTYVGIEGAGAAGFFCRRHNQCNDRYRFGRSQKRIWNGPVVCGRGIVGIGGQKLL